jgi:hypothetical protein
MRGVGWVLLPREKDEKARGCDGGIIAAAAQRFFHTKLDSGEAGGMVVSDARLSDRFVQIG